MSGVKWTENSPSPAGPVGMIPGGPSSSSSSTTQALAPYLMMGGKNLRGGGKGSVVRPGGSHGSAAVQERWSEENEGEDSMRDDTSRGDMDEDQASFEFTHSVPESTRSVETKYRAFVR